MKLPEPLRPAVRTPEEYDRRVVQVVYDTCDRFARAWPELVMNVRFADLIGAPGETVRGVLRHVNEDETEHVRLAIKRFQRRVGGWDLSDI